MLLVARRLGHAGVTTTERHDAHLTESLLAGAAARAEALVWAEASVT